MYPFRFFYLVYILLSAWHHQPKFQCLQKYMSYDKKSTNFLHAVYHLTKIPHNVFHFNEYKCHNHLLYHLTILLHNNLHHHVLIYHNLTLCYIFNILHKLIHQSKPKPYSMSLVINPKE